MKITTTTAVLPYETPACETIERLHKIGFRQLDLGFDCFMGIADHPFRQEKWEDWAKKLKEKADSLGVIYTQAHACGDAAARNEEMFRHFKICKMLGIRYSVVHPIWKKADQTFYNDEDEFLTVNVKAIKPLLEAAAESDVTILSENLLWGASIPPKILSKLVSEVNSPNFGWCYDTGHTNCCGLSFKELLNVDNIPLSLHVQDNHGLFVDEHLLPGDGTIDWQEFLKVLKQIGYKGDLVLEAHHQSLEAKTESFRNLVLSDLLSRAGKMLNFYENLK